MPQRKRIFLKAVLLPLGLLAMAAAIFRRTPDAWEYEQVEEKVAVETPVAAPLPAQRRHGEALRARSRRSRCCSSPEPRSRQAPATRWCG